MVLWYLYWIPNSFLDLELSKQINLWKVGLMRAACLSNNAIQENRKQLFIVILGNLYLYWENSSCRILIRSATQYVPSLRMYRLPFVVASLSSSIEATCAYATSLTSTIASDTFMRAGKSFLSTRITKSALV